MDRMNDGMPPGYRIVIPMRYTFRITRVLFTKLGGADGGLSSTHS